jgi:hypothetical protein
MVLLPNNLTHFLLYKTIKIIYGTHNTNNNLCLNSLKLPETTFSVRFNQEF